MLSTQAVSKRTKHQVPKGKCKTRFISQPGIPSQNTINQVALLYHSFEDQKCKTKISAWSGCDEGSLSGFQMCTFSLCPLMSKENMQKFSVVSYKIIHPLNHGSTFTISSNPNYFLKAPISECPHKSLHTNVY